MTTKRQRQIDAIGSFLASQPNYECSPQAIRTNFPELFNSDVNRPDVSQALRSMIDAGWVEKKAKRSINLTESGIVRFANRSKELVTVQPETAPVQRITETPDIEPEYRPNVVARILGSLPNAQASFIEMALCAVVARHHLREERTSSHPCFFVVGESGTGKSSLAKLVCRMLGLNEAVHVQDAHSKTRGEVRGRRYKVPGGFEYDAPREMSFPFVAFDEYDKANDVIRDGIVPFLQGRTTVYVEGKEVESLAVCMVIANPRKNGDRYGVVRPEYRRRAFTLDTRFMVRRRNEVEDFIIRAYELTEHPVLNLASAVPPVTSISAEGRAILRALPQLLTDDGADEFPGTEYLETLVYGYCGLYGITDTTKAAYYVSLAYLRCAETVGQTVPNAIKAFAHSADVRDIEVWRKGVITVMHQSGNEMVVRDETAEIMADVEWYGTRLQYAQRFEELADVLSEPPYEYDTRQNRRIYRPLIGQLHRYAELCKEADSPERLQRVIDAGTPIALQAQTYADGWGIQEVEYYENPNAETEYETVETEEPVYSASHTSIESLQKAVQIWRGKNTPQSTNAPMIQAAVSRPCNECAREGKTVRSSVTVRVTQKSPYIASASETEITTKSVCGMHYGKMTRDYPNGSGYRITVITRYTN